MMYLLVAAVVISFLLAVMVYFKPRTTPLTDAEVVRNVRSNVEFLLACNGELYTGDFQKLTIVDGKIMQSDDELLAIIKESKEN